MAPGYSTASLAVATGPTVVSTFLSHFATWPQRHKRSRHAQSSNESPVSLDTLPGNQLRYEEGLRVLRRFLEFASTHPVEEVQGYTAQPLPIPLWIRRDIVTIPEGVIEKAAEILVEHLKSYGKEEFGGIKLVGGEKWWRVRGRELEAEWIEMAKDFKTRQTRSITDSSDKVRSWRHLPSLRRAPRGIRDGAGGEVQEDRVILYVHGGAFFFSSLDLHRYQIQRHARKAGARAFVPNYRLSPQYPFPCGLLDCLAAYLYLIDPPTGVDAILPSNIILMGDSAGGGMSLSLLVLIREMGLPMPAAASLMSPWVDLTHSMPSIMKWDGGDYIPSVGFHYRPSPAWPPPPGDSITVEIDGKQKVLDEQIQLYCPNTLLTHPLVSTINNGSLGGLCPLYITGGSAELLRDEVTYIAHKAANPQQYPPSPVTLEEYPEQAALVDKYPPTRVHLQIFEGACHVATTLAWTRSAKHIFRGTANFNIWAFKAAAKGAEMKAAAEARPTKRRGTAPDTLRVKPLKGCKSAPGSAPMSPLSPTAATGAASAPMSPMLLPLGDSAMSSRNPSVPDLTEPAINSTAASMVNESPATGSDADYTSESSESSEAEFSHAPLDIIKVRGVEPQFRGRTIVAERVSTHGRISAFEPDSQVPSLDPSLRNKIGRVGGNGPIGTWLVRRHEWDTKYHAPLQHWRDSHIEDRAYAERVGFLTRDLQGEKPPLSAMVGIADREMARTVAMTVDEPVAKTSTVLVFWTKLNEAADADAVDREKDHHHHHHKDKTPGHGHGHRRRSSASKQDKDKPSKSWGDLRRSSVKDGDDKDGKAATTREGRRMSWDFRRLSLRGHKRSTSDAVTSGLSDKDGQSSPQEPLSPTKAATPNKAPDLAPITTSKPSALRASGSTTPVPTSPLPTSPLATSPVINVSDATIPTPLALAVPTPPDTQPAAEEVVGQ